MCVSRLYSTLSHQCKFDEFFITYKSLSLFRLIKKYKLTPHSDSLLCHLSIILLASPCMNYSVGGLKCSVIGTDIPPVYFVVADYRFMNCNTTKSSVIAKLVWLQNMQKYACCIQDSLGIARAMSSNRFMFCWIDLWSFCCERMLLTRLRVMWTLCTLVPRSVVPLASAFQRSYQ